MNWTWKNALIAFVILVVAFISASAIMQFAEYKILSKLLKENSDSQEIKTNE